MLLKIKYNNVINVRGKKMLTKNTKMKSKFFLFLHKCQ